MRYATAIVAALALGASASFYAPGAKAGVVVGIELPVPVVAPRVAYYPYGPAPVVAIGPAVGIGLGFAPAFYGRGFVSPAFRGRRYFHPGFAHGGLAYGGYARGGYVRGGFHR
jgi:hypothetical protein